MNEKYLNQYKLFKVTYNLTITLVAICLMLLVANIATKISGLSIEMALLLLIIPSLIHSRK